MAGAVVQTVFLGSPAPGGGEGPPGVRLEKLSQWPVGLHPLFREYREEACARYGPFVANLVRPLPRAVAMGLVKGHVAVVRGSPAGLVTYSVVRDVARLGFLHVKGEMRGEGIEGRLLEAFLRSLGQGGLEPASVVSEAMVVSHSDPDGLFESRGFAVVPRWIMRAALGPSRRARRPGPHRPGETDGLALAVRGWQAGDLRGCAEVLADANTGSTDGLIYPELLDRERAVSAVQGILAGSFGRFLRRATSVAVPSGPDRPGGGSACGISLCCRSAPGEAFVVELAVRRAWQRKGLGAVLLARSLSELSAAGVAAAVLGVTRSNHAAVRLYARHGFEVEADFSSYYLPRRKGD